MACRDGPDGKQHEVRLAFRTVEIIGPPFRRTGQRPRWVHSTDPGRERQDGATTGVPEAVRTDGQAPARNDADPPSPDRIPRLSPEGRERVLDLITKGMGRSAACRELDITMLALCGEIVSDRAFRAAVEAAEASRVEDPQAALYRRALGGSVAAAVAFIKLDQEEREARLARRQCRVRLKTQRLR